MGFLFNDRRYRILMKDKEYYAHSVEGKPPENWHRLEDHWIVKTVEKKRQRRSSSL
jgi:hypothetical protein